MSPHKTAQLPASPQRKELHIVLARAHIVSTQKALSALALRFRSSFYPSVTVWGTHNRGYFITDYTAKPQLGKYEVSQPLTPPLQLISPNTPLGLSSILF
jgi:hypothetical protein